MPEIELTDESLPQGPEETSATAVCSMCKTEKPVALFTKDASQKNGRRSSCKACKSGRDADYYKTVAERVKSKRKQRYLENSEEIKARQRARHALEPRKYAAKKKAWNTANKEKINARQRQRREVDGNYVRLREALLRLVDPERRRRISREWKARNRHMGAAQAAKRRAAQLQRTPKRLTQAELDDIRLVYEFARALELATGIPHHVDHEIPLQGKYVSGLHVLSNLQIIPASQNISKGNKWLPETERC